MLMPGNDGTKADIMSGGGFGTSLSWMRVPGFAAAITDLSASQTKRSTLFTVPVIVLTTAHVTIAVPSAF